MRAFVFAAVLASACPLLSQPATAFDMPEDEAEAQFVTSNVLAAFYHELGHALIDVLQLPVLGKEEDAADTLSALLVHDIWDESSATQIIYDTASSYAMYAAEAEARLTAEREKLAQITTSAGIVSNRRRSVAMIASAVTRANVRAPSCRPISSASGGRKSLRSSEVTDGSLKNG